MSPISHSQLSLPSRSTGSGGSTVAPRLLRKLRRGRRVGRWAVWRDNHDRVAPPRFGRLPTRTPVRCRGCRPMYEDTRGSPSRLSCLPLSSELRRTVQDLLGREAIPYGPRFAPRNLDLRNSKALLRAVAKPELGPRRRERLAHAQGPSLFAPESASFPNVNLASVVVAPGLRAEAAFGTAPGQAQTNFEEWPRTFLLV